MCTVPAAAAAAAGTLGVVCAGHAVVLLGRQRLFRCHLHCVMLTAALCLGGGVSVRLQAGTANPCIWKSVAALGVSKWLGCLLLVACRPPPLLLLEPVQVCICCLQVSKWRSARQG
jgi:hypothetical protein